MGEGSSSTTLYTPGAAVSAATVAAAASSMCTKDHTASPVPFLSEEAARAIAGDGMKLRGASNAKAKREPIFAPRPLEWMANA